MPYRGLARVLNRRVMRRNAVYGSGGGGGVGVAGGWVIGLYGENGCGDGMWQRPRYPLESVSVSVMVGT